MNLTYVTIDWDYFIPEDPMWDFGHNESQLFLKFLWATRIQYFKKMKTTGEELDFWSKLWKKLPLPVDPEIRVSDSHLSVWHDPALHVAKTVVLIDQHHDMFGDGKSDQVDCGNWLSTWLRNKSNRRAIWVKAPHTLEQFLPAGPKYRSLTRRVTVLDSINQLDPNQLKNSVLHVCRSGCWTPPWLDAKFIRFVQASGLNPHVIEEFEWANPLQTRFSLNDYRQAWRDSFHQRWRYPGFQ